MKIINCLVYIFSMLILCNIQLFAQGVNTKKNPTLEEMYRMPTNQYATFQYHDGIYDVFYCDPSKLDDISLIYFIHALQRDNKEVVQVRINVMTHIVTVVVNAGKFSEQQLSNAVFKVRNEIIDILRVSPSPHTEMEIRISKETKRKDGNG
jgi:hypothetical protein